MNLQVKKFKKYESWDPSKSGSLLVIVLSYRLIGSLSSSTANQRVAQNNYYTEQDFGVPRLCYM